MTQVEIQELPIDAPQEPAQEELAPQEPAPQEEPTPQEPAPQEPTPPKRKRGRPPGSKNVKAKAPPKAAPKAKAKPAAQEPEPQEESLPQYVQQSLPPRPQDFATQLFDLLQDHERERAGRRRATYAAWLSRF